MKTHALEKFALLGAAGLLVCTVAFARDHRDFDGTWTLDPGQSDFAGKPPMQAGTITIKDRDGITVIERNFTYDIGNRTVFYQDSLGDTHGGTVHPAKDVKTKTKWDHDILHVTTTDAGAVTQETYSLGADGRLVVNVMSPDGSPARLVFRRQ